LLCQQRKLPYWFLLFLLFSIGLFRVMRNAGGKK